MDERDGMNASSPATDFSAADNFFYRPVAAFDENVRAAFEDALQGGFLVEPGNQRHAGERRHDCQPVFQRIDRAVIAFAESFDRGVRVERDNHRAAQCGGLRQIGDVPTVQDVEAAIREHKRSGQLRASCGQLVRWADFGFEAGSGVGHGGVMGERYPAILVPVGG